MRTWLVLLLVASLWSPPARAGSTEQFPRPGSVETRVEFWTRVYTEIGTDGGFLHDSQNLDVVYRTLRFPEGASWRSQKRRIREAKREIRAILERLARGKRANLTAEEQRILALWPEGVSNATLRRAARRVRFQLGQANKFRAGLIRAGTWEPHIRRVIAEHEVPMELAALPHVESSYNPRAISKVGAAGLWQFTRSTGRRYMRVDHVVDERLDPYRSSEAAARLLRDNYERTRSWPLAITAYNHGLSGVLRAVRQVGSKDIGRIIERYRGRTFGFASQNFYSEFLAALHVEVNAERYFGRLATNRPERHEVVRLDHYYPAEALSEAFGVSLASLRELNPALRSPVWEGQKHVPRGFELRLPPAAARPSAATVLASLPPEARFERQRPDLHYRVRRGETLSTIARRFGVRQSDIMALNNLRSPHWIRAGQRLRLPQPDEPVQVAGRRPPAARSARERKLAEDGTYTVQRGDTLIAIARDLGATTEELVLANDLQQPDRLQVGQLLRIASLRADQADAEGVNEAELPAPEDAPEETLVFGPPPPPDLAERTAVVAEAPEAATPLAQPVSTEPTLPDATHASLAEAARYRLADDGSLRVQPEETLGHYAHWLDLPTHRLRRLNGLRYGTPLVIGQRLRLDFSRVSQEVFESRRVAYHRELREQFFRRHRVAGTDEHVLRRGETLWELSHRRYRIPVWLLGDFNPNVDFAELYPGVRLTIPRVEPTEHETPSAQT